MIIISLASLKRIITSGFNPELLFKIGAQADYIEVLSHVNNLLNQNIVIPLISLLNYIPGAFLGVQNRFSFKIINTNRYYYLRNFGDTYINLGMGFNVGTIHVLYFVFGFIISLFLIFFILEFYLVIYPKYFLIINLIL